MAEPVLALHGGCGVITRAQLSPADEAAARAALRLALETGYAVLLRGGPALEAVTAAVRVMEDDPTFNAGYGAALNREGFHELDASVMEGRGRRAGAVAAARRLRHPVEVAAALARQADPVLLAGQAADGWAQAHGFETVENSFFTTPRRQQLLEQMLEREAAGTAAQASEQEKHGTVGAVALDRSGNLAAATSTGGYTAKPGGRVGDSPLIGAGTWADDRTCAVSGTGKGELFIRTALAHEVHARMLYAGETLEQATRAVVAEVGGLGGGAGLCAVDRLGRVSLPFNTEGMYRGWIDAAGHRVAIYADEDDGTAEPHTATRP